MQVPRILRGALCVILAVASFGLTACGGDTTQPKKSDYLPQSSPANVLANLQVAYRERSGAEYAKLLADDFQFYFDAGTRETKGLPEFWTRVQDSTGTARLFNAPDVIAIRLVLSPQPPKPVTEPGRERWVEVDVPDAFLDVDFGPRPGNPEGYTLRVDGQLQKFFFRAGRTPADTTAGSPTRNTVYLVEWQDHGLGAFLKNPPGAAIGAGPQGMPTTWSAIKTLYL